MTIDLFESSVRNFPSHIAIEYGNEKLTYEATMSRVSAAARLLSEWGVRDSDHVVLRSRGDTATLVMYLAVMLRGATVVPVSDNLPDARVERICEILSARFSIDVEPTSSAVGWCENRVVHRRSAGGHLGAGGSSAYCLFTSGSSGEPKGVPVSQRSLDAFCKTFLGEVLDSTPNRVALTADLGFDLSVMSIWPTWASGGTVVLPGRRELLRPVDFIGRAGITHWFSVPSFIPQARLAGELSEHSHRHADLEQSVFIGERLFAKDAQDWLAAFPSSELTNCYGPTELTVACSQHRYVSGEQASGVVPIGSPFKSTDWILANGEETAREVGELLVRGIQRFDGYLRQADGGSPFASLDPQSGRLSPSSGTDPDAFYRTGDLVRAVDDSLHFLRRIDRQEKIQGFRIELGEIEVVATSVSGVDDAVASVVETAYGRAIVLAAFGTADHVELRRELARILPKYMLPKRVHVERVAPLTANRKIDRSAVSQIWRRIDRGPNELQTPKGSS